MDRSLKIAGIIIFCLIFLIIAYSGLNLFIQKPDNTITLSTTTSTENSGLLDFLHPEMTKDIGIKVDVVAVGTGAAIEQAKAGLADVIIVHAREIEDQFVSEGYGIHRVDLMYNDFIIVGPKNDPANISALLNLNSSIKALQRLYEHKNEIKFVSRGDNSGTHVKELSLWSLTNITILGDDFEWSNKNPWYLESGSGMSATLSIALELNAYTITDRGTWIYLKENLNNLEIMAQGDPLLFNPYGVILINPIKFESSKIKFAEAKEYVKWLISPKGQAMIDNYTINGEQAFFADFENHIGEMPNKELEFWGINSSVISYNMTKAPPFISNNILNIYYPIIISKNVIQTRVNYETELKIGKEINQNLKD